jgi:hypothetical protein
MPTVVRGQTYVEPGTQSGFGSILPLMPRLAVTLITMGYDAVEYQANPKRD